MKDHQINDPAVSCSVKARAAGPLGRGAGRRWVLLLAVVMTAAIALLVAPHASAQRADPLADLEREEKGQFMRYRSVFTRQFFRYGERRFVILPNIVRKRENSNGRTYDQAYEEMTKTERVRINGFWREKDYPPPHGEVVASALVIPAIDVGHYGFVNSVVVDKILGPEEMIVRDINLIPMDQVGTTENELRLQLVERQQNYRGQKHRLLGFSTEGLRQGQEYTGPEKKGVQVAVMSTDYDPANEFVLVNFEKLDRVKTSEFHEVLEYVKLTPLQFNQVVRDNRERLKGAGDKATLISLYRRLYNRYRPSKRVTQAPPQVPADEDKPEQPTDSGDDSAEDPDYGDDSEYKPLEYEDGEEPRDPKGGDDTSDDGDTKEPADAEDEEDDWDPDADTSGEEAPDFFGIPL